MNRLFGFPTVVTILALAASSLVVASTPACSSSSSSTSASQPALVGIASDVIVPTYQQVDTDAASLGTALGALQTSATQTALTAAQTAWRASRKSWHGAEAFAFGPVTSLGVTAAIDTWPADTGAVDALISGSAAIDATSVGALAPAAKGYQAIEYLLFDPTNGDTAILTKLTTDPAAARRLSFLVAVAADLKTWTSKLFTAWAPTSGNFANEVANAGNGAVLFVSGKAAVDQIVNTTILALDDVAGTKLGKPYGTQSGGLAIPADVTSPYSDNSINDFLDTIAGAKAIYVGNESALGVSSLVRAKNTALDTQVLAAFDDAVAKVNAIPAPFRTAIMDDAKRPAVNDAYQACRVLKNLIQVQVANTLGTTLQFNENDGD